MKDQSARIRQLRARIQRLKRAKRPTKLSKAFGKMSAVDVAGSDRVLREALK